MNFDKCNGAAKSLSCLPHHEVSSDEDDDVFFDCQDAVLDEPIPQAFNQMEKPRVDITPYADFTRDANQFTNEAKELAQREVKVECFHKDMIRMKEVKDSFSPKPCCTEEANLIFGKALTSDNDMKKKLRCNEDEVFVTIQQMVATPDDDSTVAFQTGDTKKTGTETVAKNTAAFHPLLLQFKECFFNWNLDTHPLSYEEAGLVVTKEIIETAVNPRLIQYLKWRPLGTISQHLTLAFCHFVRMDLTEGERELKILSSLIQTEEVERYLLPDHVEGINYVFRGLSALSQSLLMLNVDDEDRIVEENKLRDYIATHISAGEPDSFSDSAKAAIKFVKSFFMGARQIKDLQLNIAKEISEVETSNVECWTYLNTCYRLDRKAADHMAGPSVDEERTLHHAWKVDKDNVLVKLAFVNYLTDMFKAKKFKFQKHGWVVLHEVKTYHNMEEVISDIRDMCTEILKVEGMKECFRTNVCIAGIYMSGLRYYFGKMKSDELAQQCLETAVKINSKYSTASHKLGLLKLRIECSPDSAIVDVRKAFLIDQRNFPALIDIIQLLMSQPSDKEKRGELLELFSTNVVQDKWTVKQSATIHVAQGFFLFMIEQTEGAILALTTAHGISGEIVKEYLQKIPFLTQRYHWDPTLISPQRIRDFIQIEIFDKYPVDVENKANPFDMEICRQLKTYLDETLHTQGNHAAIGRQRGSSTFSGRGAGRGGFRECAQEPKPWKSSQKL